MLLHICCILLFYFLTPFSLVKSSLILPHQHPNPEEFFVPNLEAVNPEAVVLQVQRRLHESLSRKQTLSATTGRGSVNSHDQQNSCLTGNPIDDCWRCDPNWANNRQRLADCGIGFGQHARGGKGGNIYVVTDSSDRDPVNPTPGTLRHAVIQTEPLWIVFSGDMTIKLGYELIMNSYKTIDGRGANVHITGGGCFMIQYVSNIIIHNIHIHDCVPTGNVSVRSTPFHYGWRGMSDGDGISIFASQNVWIDHCDLSNCTDGLIDVVMASTGITISNNYFSHHDEVMLLGHDDKYTNDSRMQVTIAFNHFGERLVQRMPRCRHGYFHVVNNDFTRWEMYAVGGSANPTIVSQGNRYTAPSHPYFKEVTKRLNTSNEDWSRWIWKTDGDVMVNGAFFVASGAGLTTHYSNAPSAKPQPASFINRLTRTAGVIAGLRDDTVSVLSPGFSDGSGGPSSDISGGPSNPGPSSEASGGASSEASGGPSSYASGAPSKNESAPPPTTNIITYLLIISILYLNNNHCYMSSLPLLLL